MISPLLKWQLIACGALSGILLVEWMVGDASSAELEAKLNQQIQAEYQAEPLPTLSLSRQTVDSYNVIEERPLFIEGRKPLPPVAAETSDKSDGQLDDWLLIGIYNKDHRMMALFRKQNEAKTFLKLNEKQTISGWQLMQIQSDRVILQQGGQEKSIMLRKPRPQVPHPRGAARRPPPPAPARPVEPNVPPVNISPENDTNES